MSPQVPKQEQATGARPRFRLEKPDVWYGLRGLIKLSRAAALAAMLAQAPSLLNHILGEATSAEQKSFVAVECLRETFTILGPQVMDTTAEHCLLLIKSTAHSTACQKSLKSDLTTRDC